MTTKTAIDATIEHLFKRTNEQILVKSLFYSVGLNLNLKQVQQALNFKDISSVNKSIEALNGYRLNNTSFNEAFLKVEKQVYDFIQHKRVKNHLKELRGIKNRVQLTYDIVITKQQRNGI